MAKKNVEKAPKKAGRPSSYTEETGNAICERLMSGESLRSICSDEAMPEKPTVLRWLRDIEQFRTQYTIAREVQMELMAEEILSISDDDSGDDTPFTGVNHVNRHRLMVDTRKWIMSKLAPKKYGDKLDISSGGEKITSVTVSVIASREEAAKLKEGESGNNG